MGENIQNTEKADSVETKNQPEQTNPQANEQKEQEKQLLEDQGRESDEPIGEAAEKGDDTKEEKGVLEEQDLFLKPSPELEVTKEESEQIALMDIIETVKRGFDDYTKEQDPNLKLELLDSAYTKMAEALRIADAKELRKEISLKAANEGVGEIEYAESFFNQNITSIVFLG